MALELIKKSPLSLGYEFFVQKAQSGTKVEHEVVRRDDDSSLPSILQHQQLLKNDSMLNNLLS